MRETVEQIREWHRDRGDHDDTAAFYYQWIGTLLAEIERLEARLKVSEDTCNVLRAHNPVPSEVIRLNARLTLAEKVCEALGAWNAASKPDDLRRKWTAVKLAQLTYLAGIKEKGDG